MGIKNLINRVKWDLMEAQINLSLDLKDFNYGRFAALGTLASGGIVATTVQAQAQQVQLSETRRGEINELVNAEAARVVLRKSPNFSSADTTSQGYGYAFTPEGGLYHSGEGRSCDGEIGYSAIYVMDHALRNSDRTSVGATVTYVVDDNVYGYKGALANEDVSTTGGSSPARANIIGPNALPLTDSWAKIARGDVQIWGLIDGYKTPNCSSGSQSTPGPQPTPEPTSQPTPEPTPDPRPDTGCQQDPCPQ